MGFVEWSQRNVMLAKCPSGSQDESQSYGNCSECKQKRTAVAWCNNCDIAFFKENFCRWTSGNSKIDEFIRHTQLNASENMDYLEWIEFDQFDLVENINKQGAFSSIYSAIWMEGPRWSVDEEAEVWNRKGPIKVALKRLDNSQNMSQEFINQHGGNVLVESKANSIDAKIADTGLHGPVNKQISSKHIYGVIPFVAPEVFDGNTSTKESDIYSFGMIMWMLSAGVRPYNNKSHDSQLIQEICSGSRPSVISGTPPAFARLMLQCLDADPSKRPTASQLYEWLGNWVTAICDDPETKFVNLEKLNLGNLPCHENAIYFSRQLVSQI
ncbi:kinase-like protein [Rhizophagus irregularis]|uniref:Kinase-like protein n=1 Tax=Rhizophagus irregularis TaxID=588596 RepID=A0A2I1GN68_9GLOM|nr:kinase-like protein [Rhizophagus irregularis]